MEWTSPLNYLSGRRLQHSSFNAAPEVCFRPLEKPTRTHRFEYFPSRIT